mgnify:CR=1 FL=1
MSEAPRTEKHCICGDNKARCIDCLFELSCQMEAELADKDRQLTEARAEIERLKCRLEDESMRADGMTTAHAEADARNYRLQELIEQVRAEIEKATATEAERWAERLNWLHTKYGADCSGTDSADLLDCVEDEIKQVINSQSELIEQMREALEAVVRVADRATVEFNMARAAIKAAKGEI